MTLCTEASTAGWPGASAVGAFISADATTSTVLCRCGVQGELQRRAHAHPKYQASAFKTGKKFEPLTPWVELVGANIAAWQPAPRVP